MRDLPTFPYVTSLHVPEIETKVALLGHFPSLTSLTVYRQMTLCVVLELIDVHPRPSIRHMGFALDAKELKGKALEQLGERIALLEARGVETMSVLVDGRCAELRRLVRSLKWLTVDVREPEKAPK